MRARNRHLPREETLFDPSLLVEAGIPSGFPLDEDRFIILWQAPSTRTLAHLKARHPSAPIIVARFDAETPICTGRAPYWIPADFLPFRTILAIEHAAFVAQQAWRGAPPPAYQGMPLPDGDYARIGRWLELLACIATLLLLRRARPDACIVTDWVGARVARSLGLRTQRLWQADLADPNWPPRLRLREQLLGERGLLRRWRKVPPDVEFAGNQRPDVVVLLGAWVEERLLDSFPIVPLVERGAKCLLWASRRSDALDRLIARTGSTCELLPEPLPLPGTGELQRRVADWCAATCNGGYFAPLRGTLACDMVRFINWPRWVPKLLAMHRLLTGRLQALGPQLVIAPGEKDWGAYCAHHSARALGIPSVGSRHGAWPPGTFAQNYGHRWMFPPAPTRILAFTPADAELCRPACGDRPDAMIWCGNPRLDKPQRRVSPAAADSPCILLGLHGAGPGTPLGLRRRARPLSRRLVEELGARFGECVRIRPHPWDRKDDFDTRWHHLFLPQDEPLDAQLPRFAALATSYSTLAVEAAAAGLPIFVWDYAGLDFDRSEVAREGAMVVRADLDALCGELSRFLDDNSYREELIARAARFPEYLHRTLPGNAGTMRDAIADMLMEMMRPPGRPPADDR